MLGNFLIGLREGLEASLVVGILVAYLVRTGHRDSLAPIWWGTALAASLSLLVGGLLTITTDALSFRAQEGFGGVMSLIAVGFVTWMIFWMRRESRSLRGELQGRLEGALAGGGTALAVVAFLSVGREGLETALFVWSAVRAAGSGVAPALGAVLGIAVAVVIGWLLYRRSVRLDLALFFRVTGGALVVVVAGILAYAVHDLQEAQLLPGLRSTAFDVSRVVPPSSWYGTVLKGTVNFTPTATWLQVAVWVAYLVPVLVLFFRRPSDAPPVPSSPSRPTKEVVA